VEEGADIVMMSCPVSFNGHRSTSSSPNARWCASGCQLLDDEGASGENIQLTIFGNLLDYHRHPSRDSDATKFRGVYRDSWEMLWMTAIHMKAGCEFMLMGVDW